MPPGPLLPRADEPAPERADAARNREALLAAAAALVAERGVPAVTMDDVAARACVGKGTLFRRFGSREGLMGAVLDHTERDWQRQVLSGEPPLGPGAPPWERLLAFGTSRLHLNLRHAALIEATGTGAGSRSLAAVSFTVMHARHLLTELEVEGDLGYLAAALIAPLEVVVLRQQVERERLPVARVVAGWTDLASRIVGPAGPLSPRGGGADRR